MAFQWVKRASIARMLLLTAGFALMTANLAAQSPNRIALPRQRMTVQEAFREIERQTGSVLVVKSDGIDNDRTVDFRSTSVALSDVLGRALIGTGCIWQVNGGYIVIAPDEPEERQQPQVRPVAQRSQPFRVERSQLRQFELERGEPAAQTVETGPMRFAADDKLFSTPGRFDRNGTVPARFATAPRWQRSKFAVKANVLYGAATLTPNLRVELGLGNRTSIEAGVAYNGANLKGSYENNKKLVHGIALAEFRYWTCQRFAGHYFGLHGFGGFYNVGGRDIPMLFEKEFRYEGTAFGAGVSYGYMLPISPRWAVEFNVGVGAAVMKYDKYLCDKCEDLEGSYNKTYFGPTRAAINLVFTIK